MTAKHAETLSIQENHIFSSPGGTPGAIGTHSVSGTDLSICANFQPNPLSIVVGDAYQTGKTQIDRLTNSKLHYR